MAASSSSTGLKSASSPMLTGSVPPRTLRTSYRPSPVRAISTERRVSSVIRETYSQIEHDRAERPRGADERVAVGRRLHRLRRVGHRAGQQAGLAAVADA